MKYKRELEVKGNLCVEDKAVQRATADIMLVISPDNKAFNSFVMFVAEMVDKYGDEILKEVNNNEII